MSFLQLELTDLLSSELRAQQSARSGPFLSIGGELCEAGIRDRLH